MGTRSIQTVKVTNGYGDCCRLGKYQHQLQYFHVLNVNTITCVYMNIVLSHQATNIKQQTIIKLQETLNY